MSGGGIAALQRLDALAVEVRLGESGGLLWRPAGAIGPDAEAEARALVRGARPAIVAALLAPCPFPLACGGLGPCERRFRGQPCTIATTDGGTTIQEEGEG